MTTTIGVISDTHIDTEGTKLDPEVRSHFSTVDLIVHAGDLVVLDVLEQLEAIAPVKAVHGNMCHPEVKQALPSQRFFTIEDLKIGVTHGWGAPFGLIKRVDSIAASNDCDIFISGHSHRETVQEYNGRLHINPGSAKQSRWSSGATLAKLRIDGSEADAELIKL